MVKYEMKLEDDELRRREEMELKQQKQQRDWGLRPWGGLQCTGITKSTTSAAAAPQLPNGGPSSALDDVGPHAARTSGPLGNNHRSLHSGTFQNERMRRKRMCSSLVAVHIFNLLLKNDMLTAPKLNIHTQRCSQHQRVISTKAAPPCAASSSRPQPKPRRPWLFCGTPPPRRWHHH